jgi:hypothetical protein
MTQWINEQMNWTEPSQSKKSKWLKIQENCSPSLVIKEIQIKSMQISTTTMGNSMEASQKTKNRTTMWSSNSTPGDIHKEM